jgi:UDP-glucuronate 4-epimerase
MEIVVFSLKKNFMDIQTCDEPATHADVSKLEEYVNFRPKTSVAEGVKRFVDWYLKNEKGNHNTV